MGVRAGQCYGRNKPKRLYCPKCGKKGVCPAKPTQVGLLRECRYCMATWVGDDAWKEARAAVEVDVRRFVDFNPDPFGRRWIVGPGEQRQGQRGKSLGTIDLRHGSGYSVILQMDDGRLDTFAPMSLYPEQDPA